MSRQYVHDANGDLLHVSQIELPAQDFYPRSRTTPPWQPRHLTLDPFGPQAAEWAAAVAEHERNR